MTNTQDTRETLEAFFSPFVKHVHFLNSHYNRERQKATLKRFEFSYGFDKQYQTNKPLFSLYFTYNEGKVQQTTWEAEQLDEFEAYCDALHHVAYAMGN